MTLQMVGGPTTQTKWNAMIEPEDIMSAKWLEWYRMTPQERWAAQHIA